MDVHPMVEGLFLLFSTYKNLSSKKIIRIKIIGVTRLELATSRPPV